MVVVAAAAVVGAVWARPVPVAVVAVVGGAAVVWRRAVLVAIAVLLAASGLAVRAWDGVAPPPPRSVEGVATLVSDPERFGERVRADVRLDGRRYESWASGDAGALMASRLAGERVQVRGRVTPPRPAVRMRLAVRHIGARLDITAAAPAGPGTLPMRAGNGLRRILDRGAAALDPPARPLLNGIVLGDDREQTPEMEDDFRAAGLSHLLAVSGQNVAFVLALAAPLLQRLPLAGRAAAGAAVLGMFGLMTRWEPSVLRAVAMAGIAMCAAVAGRPQPGFRVLAIAVTALVLIDPLLVHRAGFLLSVGACVGIALLAGPIARRLPGPRWLAGPLSVTLAAQAGVAPVLLPVFGPMPLVAVPANLLAVPVAGPLMMWGMTAGLAAGVAGPAVAAVLHVPTRLMLGWIAGVARIAAAAPLGRITVGHLLAVVLAAVAWRWRGLRSTGAAGPRSRDRDADTPASRSRRIGTRSWVAALAGAVAVAGLVASTVAGLSPVPAPEGTEIAPGTVVYAAGPHAVVISDGRASTARVLSGLRRANVRRPALLVVTGGGRTAAGQLGAVVVRLRPAAVLVPTGVMLQGATVVTNATRARAGPFSVTVVPDGRRLVVRVTHGR